MNRGRIMTSASPYMDDIIIYSDSFEDHINHVRKVLQRLCQKGVKLKARRCKLFKHEVTIFGGLYPLKDIELIHQMGKQFKN